MRLPLLIFHITGGIMGLLSGAAAMSFRKGSERHRVAGEVFVISMLVMGGCGFLLALLKRQTGNVFGGLLTLYMIMTAWLTARRRPNQTGVFDWLTMVLGLAIGATLLNLGMLVVTGRSTSQPGVPEGMYFVLGSIPILGGAGDLRMLARGGVSGTQRVRRHLWRMCFGLFIATGSFFLGQQQVFPAAIRKQYLLVPLAILPLVLLVYWLLHVSLKRRTNNPSAQLEVAKA